MNQTHLSNRNTSARLSVMMSNGKNIHELAREGQKHLEDTIELAFHIFSSMNDELSDPTSWSTISASAPHFPNGDASDSSHQSDCVLVDEVAWLRYESAVASLRSVLIAITSHQKPKVLESSSTVGGSETHEDQAEMGNVADRVTNLRKELAEKNKHMKLLIDQLRELITETSTWQGPCSL